MSYSNVGINFENTRIEADGGDKAKGLECYGIGLYIINNIVCDRNWYNVGFISVYPENCGSYHGPHSISCLITIWEEVGCKIKGLRYPGVLTNADANTLKNMNLRNVRANMESVKSAADGGNADQQLNCYGIAIPNTCDSHNGPHSVGCLTTIWESKGCLGEGTKAPDKLNTAEKEALDLLNLDDVGHNFETLRIEADGGDKDKGLECYGLVYPENCDSYHGPHSIGCLTTIWIEVGCKVEGLKYPAS
ncbi:uncharacterized protein LOC144745378 [Ciona intestinalis]